MSLITLDFETYFDDQYSLKKLTTVNYIRDPRFKTQGVGVQIDNGDTEYWYGADITQLYDLNLGEHELLAHHTHFEGLVLHHHYGLVPGIYRDTLSIAAALHQGNLGLSLEVLLPHYNLGQKGTELTQFKGRRNLSDADQVILGNYCIGDTRDTKRLYDVIGPQLPEDEHYFIHLLLEMFCHPRLRVNKALALEAIDEELIERQRLIDSSGYTGKQLSSNKQFAEILTSLGITPPTKPSPTNPEKTTFAFAKNDLAFKRLLTDHPEIHPLIEARTAVKSTQTVTRGQRLIEHSATGALPLYYKFWGGHTGRASGGDKLNPQNFLRGGKLRRAIIAEDDHVIVVADSSQIEARFTADLAHHDELLELFRSGTDPYNEFASVIYDRKIDRKNNPDDFIPGFIGKMCILGLGFGMGWFTFRTHLAKGAMGGPPVFLKEYESQNIVNIWREHNKPIVDLWHFCDDMLHLMSNPQMAPVDYHCVRFEFEKVILPNGHYLSFPNLAADHNMQYSYQTLQGRKHIYGAKLVENIVQALARLAVFEQMATIRRNGIPLVLTTHDEAAGLAHRSRADTVLDFMLETMATPPRWSPNIPLAAEGGWDTCYSK